VCERTVRNWHRCVPFTDGVVRDVYEDADGRQSVIGCEGERLDQ